jgi:hypothetical protein
VVEDPNSLYESADLVRRWKRGVHDHRPQVVQPRRARPLPKQAGVSAASTRPATIGSATPRSRFPTTSPCCARPRCYQSPIEMRPVMASGSAGPSSCTCRPPRGAGSLPCSSTVRRASVRRQVAGRRRCDQAAGRTRPGGRHRRFLNVQVNSHDFGGREVTMGLQAQVTYGSRTVPICPRCSSRPRQPFAGSRRDRTDHADREGLASRRLRRPQWPGGTTSTTCPQVRRAILMRAAGPGCHGGSRHGQRHVGRVFPDRVPAATIHSAFGGSGRPASRPGTATMRSCTSIEIDNQLGQVLCPRGGALRRCPLNVAPMRARRGVLPDASGRSSRAASAP